MKNPMEMRIIREYEHRGRTWELLCDDDGELYERLKGTRDLVGGAGTLEELKAKEEKEQRDADRDREVAELRKALSEHTPPNPFAAPQADAAFKACNGQRDEDGSYSGARFVKVWHALCEASYASVVNDQYSFSGTQTDLKRLCLAYRFNNWTTLCRWVKAKGKSIPIDSLTNKVLSPAASAAFVRMENYLFKKGLHY